MRALIALTVVVGVVAPSSIVALAQPQPMAVTRRRVPHEDRAPVVEVVTVGIGAEIFERWGHTAICLRYHAPENAPVCFDYGVTEFDGDAAGLGWRFVRGAQRFWVEPSRRDAMLAYYAGEDRDIWSQTLRLSEPNARDLERRLWAGIDRRRRFYVYDHLKDNCTTRVRDLVDDATDGALGTGSRGPYPRTYREIGRTGLAEMPMLVVLADFVAGRQVDRPITIWEAMFHPDVFRRQLESQLGAASHVVHTRRAPAFPTEGPSGRWVMIVVALVFALPLLVATWRRRGETPARIAAVLYVALWGVVLYAAALLSPIEGVRWNEALFVLMPFDLAILWLSPERRRRYAQIRVAGLALVAALCLATVLRQPLWVPILTAILPLAIVAFGEKIPAPARAA